LELFRALTFVADQKALGAQENRPDELLTFQFWLQLEILTVLSFIFSNMLYLFIRNFLPTKNNIALMSYEEK